MAPKRVGIVLFDRVEELDVVGPYEVFTWAASMRSELFQVMLIAERNEAVRCDKGLRILPDRTFGDCPQLDLMIVPGGFGTRLQLGNETLLSFINGQAATCEWLASVCTGLRLLAATGLADGKRVTTYHGAIQEMREGRRFAEVLDDVRFVRDGRLVTSAGVSAGIDMALWLVGAMTGEPAFARAVQRGIEYHPAPPYTADA